MSSHMVAEKKGMTPPTQEDLNRLRSSAQKKEAELNKTIDSLQDQLNEMKSQGEDMEDSEELRKKVLSLRGDLTKAQKDLKAETDERTKLQRQGAITRMAAKYSVDEEALSNCADEREMELTAREIAIAKKEAEPNAPPKDKHEVGVGAGSSSQEKLEGQAAIAQGWADWDKKKEK